ncbi:MAG: hypothetical protein AAGH65_04315, partial [Pseudomonadota bacterium]
RHRAEAPNVIIDQMRAGVRTHFESLLDASELINIDIEFLRSGTSSLDYEVEVDVSGRAAHRFEELERELARCVLMLANQHNWVIPYRQVVVHKPS